MTNPPELLTDRDAVAAALAARTEGPDRIGTARWSPCCRDAYSLAIEEAADVLAPLLAQARADAGAAALAPVERLADEWERRDEHDGSFMWGRRARDLRTVLVEGKEASRG